MKGQISQGQYIANFQIEEHQPQSQRHTNSLYLNTKPKEGTSLPNETKFFIVDAEKESQEVITENNLDEIVLGDQEMLYRYAYQYYRGKYGFPIAEIPTEVLESDAYRNIPIERALQTIFMLGLKPDDGWLFKHAIMLEAMPLPPLIIQDTTYDHVRYFFNNKVINNVYKPGLFYIKKNISMLKLLNNSRTIAPPKFIFQDKLHRKYSVNLPFLYKKWLSNPKNRNLIEYNHKTVRVSLIQETQNLEKAILSSKNKVTVIMDRHYDLDLKQFSSDSNSKVFSPKVEINFGQISRIFTCWNC